MKLDMFSYRTTSGWSTDPLPALDSDNTLVVVFGAPELDDVRQPLSELVAAFSNSHVVGCSTAGEIFGTALADSSLSIAVAQFERGTRSTTRRCGVCCCSRMACTSTAPSSCAA
jgi:hypothetical protein